MSTKRRKDSAPSSAGESINLWINTGNSEDRRTEGSITPSTAALNRKLGKISAPRMLTRSEIDLLRQSAREIAAAAREAYNRRKGSRDRPAKPCDQHPRR